MRERCSTERSPYLPRDVSLRDRESRLIRVDIRRFARENVHELLTLREELVLLVDRRVNLLEKNLRVDHQLLQRDDTIVDLPQRLALNVHVLLHVGDTAKTG